MARVVGHETTASAIQFTLFDLAQNADVQTKLRQEISEIDIGNLDAIENLPYLDAVAREG